MATLEYVGYWNKMYEAHMLTRLWKWNLGYYKVHANLKMPQQCEIILFPPLPFFD
jgi:hypothetical protein